MIILFYLLIKSVFQSNHLFISSLTFNRAFSRDNLHLKSFFSFLLKIILSKFIHISISMVYVKSLMNEKLRSLNFI